MCGDGLMAGKISGDNVDDKRHFVRPALWLNLDKVQ